MLKALHKSLKKTLSEEEGEAERSSANLPENHTRRMRRNKKRSGKEF